MRVDAIGFQPVGAVPPRSAVPHEPGAWSSVAATQRLLSKEDHKEKDRARAAVRKTGLDAISDLAAAIVVRPRGDDERDLVDERR